MWRDRCTITANDEPKWTDLNFYVIPISIDSLFDQEILKNN